MLLQHSHDLRFPVAITPGHAHACASACEIPCSAICRSETRALPIYTWTRKAATEGENKRRRRGPCELKNALHKVIVLSEMPKHILVAASCPQLLRTHTMWYLRVSSRACWQKLRKPKSHVSMPRWLYMRHCKLPSNLPATRGRKDQGLQTCE